MFAIVRDDEGTFLGKRMDTYSMTAPTLDQETLSTCVRQLEDVFVKLRHPQGSYVPPFVLKKLQQVLIYLEALEKSEKERNHGT